MKAKKTNTEEKPIHLVNEPSEEYNKNPWQNVTEAEIEFVKKGLSSIKKSPLVNNDDFLKEMNAKYL